MISTGDPGLNECLDGGYHDGDLIVVAGGVASGKSTWLRRAVRLALNAGKTAAVMDLEGTIAKHFRGEPGFAVLPEMASLANPQNNKFDMLVFDCVQAYAPENPGPELQLADRAKWLASTFIPMLKRLDHPVKIVSWQPPRRDADTILTLPRILNYSADVVLRLESQDRNNFRAILRKNRFGLTGNTFGYSLPDAFPIHRPTIWERLEHT